MNNQLSFDGPNIETLLEQVQREHGPDVTIVDARQFRRGGVAGFFAKEWYELVVQVPTEPETGDPIEPAPGRSVEPESATGELDPLIEWALAVDDRREVETGGGATAADPDPADAFALALASAHREAALGNHRAEDPGHQVLAAVQTLSTPAPGTATAVPAPRTSRLRDLDLARLLAHLEQVVPEHTVPERSDPVIAVVGETSAARAAASALAATYGLEADDVLVARPESVAGTPPWVELTTPSQVRIRARRWADCGHATIVVVELAPGLEGHAWAASILSALGADQVRLVARAWQLTDQLHAKSQALGGVDGLDVVEVDTAAEPELFLELDLPVLAFDGRPATAELWAALLYERRIDEHRDA